MNGSNNRIWRINKKVIKIYDEVMKKSLCHHSR